MDAFETGYKAGKMLFALVRKQIEPVCHWRKIPMITPNEQHLTAEEGPYARLFEKVKEFEKMTNVLSVSLFSVAPYLDVPDLGYCTMVYTNGDQNLSQRLADQLARQALNSRHDLLVTKIPLKEGLERALNSR